jgi:transcriptional regulator with GAF, ATPase, and Fis domain
MAHREPGWQLSEHTAMNLWYQFLSEDNNNTLLRTMLEELRHAGVEAKPCRGEAPSVPGIVFLKEAGERACEFIHRSSAAGRTRVLVVALEEAAFTNGAVWRLLRAGAADVLLWKEARDLARELAARFERWQQVDELVHSPVVQENLIGQSPAWLSLLRQIVEIARFTTAAVLLMGASGTGKELAARLIHTLDPRPRKGELVVLDCTTVVPDLSGSEFFGHERGSFTGAVASRKGAFSLADGGTLFLDEVGELPMRLQAELLRVVQEQTFKRVGSNTWQKTEFRLVCATNRELLAERINGNFRSDLYYRIANWSCCLPRLSERREDILPLARHFIRQLSPHGDPPEMNQPVQEYLMTRDYPGNIRELKQCISRIVYRHTGRGPITAGDIPEDERPVGKRLVTGWRDAEFENAIRRAVLMRANLRQIGQAAEDSAVREALAEAGGNLKLAAQRLGVTDRALQMRRAGWRREQGRVGAPVAAPLKRTPKRATDRPVTDGVSQNSNDPSC